MRIIIICLVAVFLILSVCSLTYGLELEEYFTVNEIDPEIILYQDCFLYIGDRQSPIILKMNVTNGLYFATTLQDRDACLWFHKGNNDNNMLVNSVGNGDGMYYLDKVNMINMITTASCSTPGKVIKTAFIPGSNYLLCVCKDEESSLIGIDYLDMSIVYIIALEDDPQYVIVNSNGSKAFISHTQGGYLSFWDITTIPHFDISHGFDVNVGDIPGEIAYSPLEEEIYVCCIGSGCIIAIDGNDGEIMQTVTTGIRSFRMDYDAVHNYLWIGRSTDDSLTNAEVYRIDLNIIPATVLTYSLPERLIDGRLSPDCSKYIATVSTWDKYEPLFHIWSIDVATGGSESFQYDGGILYVCYDDFGFAYTTDVQGKKVLKINP